jgi:hypothetical protein
VKDTGILRAAGPLVDVGGRARSPGSGRLARGPGRHGRAQRSDRPVAGAGTPRSPRRRLPVPAGSREGRRRPKSTVTPCRSASRRARSTATAEKSTAVTCQPNPASQIALRPSPAPLSSARPGGVPVNSSATNGSAHHPTPGRSPDSGCPRRHRPRFSLSVQVRPVRRRVRQRRGSGTRRGVRAA